LRAIETRGLTRRFGKTVAVDHLDLAVPAGALFGLIGPNGAGKTTTLRMLAGLLEPTSGEIVLDGQVANHDWRELQRQIGYMPDFFGVYEDMLVWEYLDFFARCYGVSRARRAQVMGELLELVDAKLGKRAADRAKRKEERMQAMKEGRHPQELLDFAELRRIVGFDDYYAEEERYAKP